ncbi:uncharacterized protein LOC130382754 [Gadus chalcogrammus]|uniref:uncharacterized protein LOC130382754 n=1 Tax=Gadus chalcogrammus TaxID=1042646 RepID=UPI0024C28310|nr:uncharacterized protein LOC130382754 [Gadus chalcogrammus]
MTTHKATHHWMIIIEWAGPIPSTGTNVYQLSCASVFIRGLHSEGRFAFSFLSETPAVSKEEDEYTDDSSAAILRLLMQKGEDCCQKFISLVLKNPEVQETFPRLKDLDWASLDSPPPPVPERTSMPGQGPRPERRDGPGFGGHQAPGSSTMENDVATPQVFSRLFKLVPNSLLAVVAIFLSLLYCASAALPNQQIMQKSMSWGLR